MLESRHPKLATHLESLGGGTFSFYGSWFRSFFVGWITSEDTFNIVDCYLSEGPKVLIRFGIAFLKLCSKELMKAMSGERPRIGKVAWLSMVHGRLA